MCSLYFVLSFPEKPIKMMDVFCTCFLKSFVYEPARIWSTILEFLLSLLISISGVVLNYSFMRKLEREKKETPSNRKGNVIEPIMRCFCRLQIIYWPLQLLCSWINSNNIIPAERIPGGICYILAHTTITGRAYIAYNSFFVAAIRYAYIVHHLKMNQWSFKKVGKYFQMASIFIPVAICSVGAFTWHVSMIWITKTQRFQNCVLVYHATVDIESFKPATVEMTIKYLPEVFVQILDFACTIVNSIIYSNVIEVFLYLRIFQSVKR